MSHEASEIRTKPGMIKETQSCARMIREAGRLTRQRRDKSVKGKSRVENTWCDGKIWKINIKGK